MALVVTGANRHDMSPLAAVLESVIIERPDICERPQHLCLDRGYAGEPALETVVVRGFIPHIKSRVNPFAFRKNARLCNLITDLAGAVTNFVVAFISGGILMFFLYRGSDIGAPGMMILYYMMYMNLVLMLFNLLPVPPLDGFGVVTEIFDLRKKSWYASAQSYGYLILLALIITGLIGKILSPMLEGITGFIVNVWGKALETLL